MILILDSIKMFRNTFKSISRLTNASKIFWTIFCKKKVLTQISIQQMYKCLLLCFSLLILGIKFKISKIIRIKNFKVYLFLLFWLIENFLLSPFLGLKANKKITLLLMVMS